MKHAAICGLFAFAGAASAQTILYDTFNEDDQANLFDCCQFVPIAPWGSRYATAQVPFTVPVKTHLIEIDIPLFESHGKFHAMRVVVVGEQGKKHGFHVGPIQGEQCCAFVPIETNPVAVAPGVNYGIYVHALRQTYGGWALNTEGATGDYTTWDNDGEHQQNGTLPAMRIIGR